MTDETFDVDDQLAEIERFIQRVQAGQIGTTEAMAAYRDRHRPAIARLRDELAAFRALLDDEAVTPDGRDPGDERPDEGHPA